MCNTLRNAGVNGFHFYTLNLENSVMAVLDGLQVGKYLLLQPLPRYLLALTHAITLSEHTLFPSLSWTLHSAMILTSFDVHCLVIMPPQ